MSSANEEHTQLLARLAAQVQQMHAEAKAIRRKRRTLAGKREQMRQEIARRSAAGFAPASAETELLRNLDPQSFDRLLAREAELLRERGGPDDWLAFVQAAESLLEEAAALVSRLEQLPSLPLNDDAYLSELEQVLALDERLRAAVQDHLAEESHESGS